jgi:hypothetical protein
VGHDSRDAKLHHSKSRKTVNGQMMNSELKMRYVRFSENPIAAAVCNTTPTPTEKTAGHQRIFRVGVSFEESVAAASVAIIQSPCMKGRADDDEPS